MATMCVIADEQKKAAVGVSVRVVRLDVEQRVGHARPGAVPVLVARQRRVVGPAVVQPPRRVEDGQAERGDERDESEERHFFTVSEATLFAPA